MKRTILTRKEGIIKERSGNINIINEVTRKLLDDRSDVTAVNQEAEAARSRNSLLSAELTKLNAAEIKVDLDYKRTVARIKKH